MFVDLERVAYFFLCYYLDEFLVLSEYNRILELGWGGVNPVHQVMRWWETPILKVANFFLFLCQFFFLCFFLNLLIHIPKPFYPSCWINILHSCRHMVQQMNKTDTELTFLHWGWGSFFVERLNLKICSANKYFYNLQSGISKQFFFFFL